MLPKKIYLNYVDENDEDKTWSEEPISVYDCKMQNRKYTDLSQVWHEASEFPNKALPIIVEIDDDIEPSYEVISIDETDEKFWEYLVSDRDITIWAYVKDLLPKGGLK